MQTGNGSIQLLWVPKRMSPKMNCLINFSSRQWVSLCSVYTASNINQKNYAGIEKVDQILS